MADRSCRSRRGGPPLCRETPILLSDIKYNSTCITLQIPLDLACGECKKQLNPLENTRKKRKSERQKCERRRCEQYWCSKYGLNMSSTEGHALMHRKVRRWLRIEQDIDIHFENAYSNEPSSNVCDYVPTKSSPSASIVYDMINNSTACKETNIPRSIK